MSTISKSEDDTAKPDESIFMSGECKVYKLFYGEAYYPLGGYEDFNGNFSSIESAIEHIESMDKNEMSGRYWAHIVMNDQIVKVGVFYDNNYEGEKHGWTWKEYEKDPG